MLHTLCHSVIFYLTLFPGILLFSVKKQSVYRYGLALLSVLLLNILWFKGVNSLIELVIMVFIGPLLYWVEKVLLVKKIAIYFNKLQLQSMIIVVIIPIIEELIFRLYIYKHIFETINGPYIVKSTIFVLISSVGFIIAHIKILKFKAIYKLLFAITTCIIYAVSLNIFICIIIHIAFNFITFIAQIPKLDRRGNFD